MKSITQFPDKSLLLTQMDLEKNWSNDWLKIKVIFLPTLLVMVLVWLISFTLEHFLVFKYQILQVKVSIWQFWFPFVLSILTMVFFIWPRLNLFKFKNDNKLYLAIFLFF